MIASDMRYHKELYTVTSRGQIQKSFKEFKLPRVVEKNGKNDIMPETGCSFARGLPVASDCGRPLNPPFRYFGSAPACI